MTDPANRLLELLDRAAGDDVAPPPLDDLVRRGTARRRKHVWLAAAATVAVLGGFVGAGLAIQNADSERQTPDLGSPTPTPTSTQALTGPTAQQLADGQWRAIAAAPFRMCDGMVSAWGGGRLLVISPDCDGSASTADRELSAGLYDPSKDAWTPTSPPRGLTGSVLVTWAGERFVAVSKTDGGAAYLTWVNPEFTETGEREPQWEYLPVLPATGHEAELTSVDNEPVIAGAGRSADRVFRFDSGSNSWEELPRLPSAPEIVVNDERSPAVSDLTVAAVGGQLYAYEVITRLKPPDAGAAPHLLRLSGDAWVELPRPDGLPWITHAEPYASSLLVSGGNCSRLGDCPIPIAPQSPGLFDPGTGQYTNLSLGSTYEVVRVGGAIVGYNARYQGAGDTFAWDAERQQWLAAPSSGRGLTLSAVVAGTPHGLVVLEGDSGGFILRPAE